MIKWIVKHAFRHGYKDDPICGTCVAYILLIVIAIISGIIMIICALPSVSEGQDITPLDVEIAKELVGTWKELHAQGCLEGETLIVYYPDMTFEEHTTYMAMDPCKIIGGRFLQAGESYRKSTFGSWIVSQGYLYYKTLNNKISKIRVLSIGKSKAVYQWDNGDVCEGYRIDLHVKKR